MSILIVTVYAVSGLMANGYIVSGTMYAPSGMRCHPQVLGCVAMSYCRSGGPDSDVYLIGCRYALECFGGGWRLEGTAPVHERGEFPTYEATDEGIVEPGGIHEEELTFSTASRGEMITHLEAHRAAGHKVPEYAFDRLRREIETEGDDYTVHEE